MKDESDAKEALAAQLASSVQEDPPSPLITLNRHLAEVLVAQQEISDRLAAIERQTTGIAARDAGAPETKALWEDTVRRFTGSIDVRLDILEDELGGLQDELNRLRQVASESADGVRRHLTRRNALGQVILGVLILALLLMVWSGGASYRLEAPRPEPGADAPNASSLSDRSPPDAESTGVALARSASARSESGVDQGAPPAAVSESSVPVQKARAIDAGVESPTAAGIQEQRSGGHGGSEDAGEPNGALALAASSANGQGAGESGGTKPAPQVAGVSGASTESYETSTAAERDAGSDVESGDGTIVLTEDGFAVQLVGYNSESWVWRFVEKFGISGTARYLHIPDQERDMYVVLLGNYSTKEEAKAAIAALSSELRDLKPLVRPLPAGTELIPAGAATRAQ